MLLLGCTNQAAEDLPDLATAVPTDTIPVQPTIVEEEAIETAVPQPNLPSSNLIQPEDLTYLGAFRLPGESGGSSWEYSGYAMTYYPNGDPAGPEDGFPGSLFAVGHDQQQFVSEISIPEPIISSAKNPADLNTAVTLQPFADIRGGLFDYLEIPPA